MPPDRDCSGLPPWSPREPSRKGSPTASTRRSARGHDWIDVRGPCRRRRLAAQARFHEVDDCGALAAGRRRLTGSRGCPCQRIRGRQPARQMKSALCRRHMSALTTISCRWSSSSHGFEDVGVEDGGCFRGDVAALVGDRGERCAGVVRVWDPFDESCRFEAVDHVGDAGSGEPVVVHRSCRGAACPSW